MRLGLSGGRAVAEAFGDLSRRLGAGPALVQRQPGPGVELVACSARSVIWANRDGRTRSVWIEVLEDVALRLAPIDADEARAMLDELKGHKLFTGVRGRPPVDGVRLARLIADLSQWFCAAAWLGEVDLNPIIANGDEFSIVDVRIRVIDRSTIA